MSVKIRGIIKRTSVLFLGAAMLLLCACEKSGDKSVAAKIAEEYNVSHEKQLIVYTSHKEEVYLPIILEFENRTGIWVEIHAGGTTEMFKEVREASEEGRCDIMFGGGIESFAAARDLFMPYEVNGRENLDPSYLSSDNLWTPFTELPLVFIYNSKLVPEEEAPKSWQDLLSDKWKGQIAFADLHNSGTSYTILSTLSQIAGEDRLKDFMEGLKGNVLSSSGEIVADVSNGTFLVGVTLEETAKKSVLAGYDIVVVYPEEGTTSVPDGCAMVKNAPHSYNAGKFIDFVTGYDTQKYAMDRFLRRPVRTDIALSEGFEALTQIDFDIEKSAKEEESVFALWDSIIGKEGE